MFRLDPAFVRSFASRHAPFGFNGLGELVYRRTYSRPKNNGQHENWYETIERVVNGCYNMQYQWTNEYNRSWNDTQAQYSAQEMYRRMYDMKFLPPGRGLWAMGTALTEQRNLYAALNNCAFVSTADMHNSDIHDICKPFAFLMDASMLGIGVGFDTKGANSVLIHGPNNQLTPVIHTIPDSREGWVTSVQCLLQCYFTHTARIKFDYTPIRPRGSIIHGFGGIASGYQALEELHVGISSILDKRIGSTITITDIVDIMNMIGRCVIAGNVRRTAEIAFGDPTSMEYLNLKNYKSNPDRAAWGWCSNNSIFAEVGMDYSAVVERIIDNGEPGCAWLSNMQSYGRMNGITDTRDWRAMGGNPCLEQTLESYEMCCLVETFPAVHDNLQDYLQTLKYAFLYAKSVTLGETHWPETNVVMSRNRRIGTSVSGVAQYLARYDVHTLQHWLDTGYKTVQQYDQLYSKWLNIPESIKITSVKPSGTVSLLAGATPGMHYPSTEYYIRRVRLSANSDLVPPLQEAGYHCEPAIGDEQNTVVVEFPVHVGNNVRTLENVSMWEQLALAAFLQRHWADNQVSCTITFDPATEANQLSHALQYYQYQLKGVSFISKSVANIYKQVPYEAITMETYKQYIARLQPIKFKGTNISVTDKEIDRFCDSVHCTL